MKANRWQIILITGLLVSSVSCGGGGGTKSVEPVGDISGRWDVSEVSDERACDSGFITSTYSLDLNQSGSSVTAVTNTGSYTANINGTDLVWSGSFPEDGGTVQSNVSLTIDASCNSLSGSAGWSWSDGFESCSGTSQISATRANPVGCGTGSGTTTNSLNGNWRGTFRNDVGEMGVITVNISGSIISGITPAGAFSGTIFQEQGDIWGFRLDDGTEGGFLHDPSATHAVFLDEDFNFGVVQKGVSGSTSYSGTDIVGTWDGTFVTLDAYFFLASNGNASASVFPDGSFFGSSSAPDNFTGEIGQFSSRFGLWVGSNHVNISSSANGSGHLSVFLSDDKNFAGSYACFPNNQAFPDGCAFNMWNRQ